MKKPSNWENVKPSGEYAPLPAGGYICKVLKAEEKTYPGNGNPFSRLEVSIDIEAGEYKGHYESDYRMQQQEDKRWKGVLRLYVPKDDGSEQDAWTQQKMKDLEYAAEESNPGYRFDFDHPELLKDKIIGVLFRNEEWAFDGKTGWKAQPFKPIPVDAINKQAFRMPKDKPLANKPVANNASVLDSDGDLPF